VALTVTGKLMRSTETSHIGRFADGGWTVSWLPGRVLGEDDAGVAMAIAETAAGGIWQSDDPRWPALDALAARLGLTGAGAVMLVTSVPPGAL
jgi:hypothetical protein